MDIGRPSQGWRVGTARTVTAMASRAPLTENACSLLAILLARDRAVPEVRFEANTIDAVVSICRLHQHPELAPGEVGDLAGGLLQKQTTPTSEAVPNPVGRQSLRSHGALPMTSAPKKSCCAEHGHQGDHGQTPSHEPACRASNLELFGDLHGRH